jgi:hypothetical protein
MTTKGDNEASKIRVQGLKRVISFARVKVHSVFKKICIWFNFVTKGGLRISGFLPQTNYYYFEASISPVKYAVFQLLGHLSIISLFNTPPFDLPASSSTSAKMGALGGLVLTIYYLVHLCICNTWFYEGRPLEPPSTYLVMFAQEVLHSGIAAVLGATIIGFRSYFQLASMAVVGLLGPVALVTILFTVLGMALVILWFVKYLTEHRLGH